MSRSFKPSRGTSVGPWPCSGSERVIAYVYAGRTPVVEVAERDLAHGLRRTEDEGSLPILEPDVHVSDRARSVAAAVAATDEVEHNLLARAAGNDFLCNKWVLSLSASDGLQSRWTPARSRNASKNRRGAVQKASQGST